MTDLFKVIMPPIRKGVPVKAWIEGVPPEVC